MGGGKIDFSSQNVSKIIFSIESCLMFRAGDGAHCTVPLVE